VLEENDDIIYLKGNDKKNMQRGIIVDKYTINGSNPNDPQGPLYIDMTSREANGTSHPS